MFRVLVILSLVILAGGCTRTEPIVKYRAPRLASGAEDAAPALGKSVPARLLVAMLPHQETMWFFRFNGPEEIITFHEKEFLNFLQTIQFPAKGERITWELPGGWVEQAAGAEVYANLVVPGAPPQKVVVVALPLKANQGREMLVKNLDRWRGKYLNVGPIDPADVDKVARPLEFGGTTGTLIDMKGTQVTGAGSGGLPAGHPPVGAAPLPFEADVPRDWVRPPKAPDTFVVPEDGKLGAVILFFPETAEGWPIIIEQLRRDFELEPIGAEDILKAESVLEAGDRKLNAVEIHLPAEKTFSRWLGVRVPRAGKTWVFVMLGRDEAVARRREEFHNFVRSVK